MTWQDYTVWAVGLVVVLSVARRLWRVMCGNARKGCASCADTACPLRDLKSRRKGL